MMWPPPLERHLVRSPFARGASAFVVNLVSRHGGGRGESVLIKGVDVSVCLDDISKHGFHLTAAHKRITHLAVARVPVISERALVYRPWNLPQNSSRCWLRACTLEDNPEPACRVRV
jgi:hypothetical protein